jgi:hypothetical protein
MALFIFLFPGFSVGKGGLVDKDYVARNGKVYILEALGEAAKRAKSKAFSDTTKHHAFIATQYAPLTSLSSCESSSS